jgi:hypothetical protein
LKNPPCGTQKARGSELNQHEARDRFELYPPES